jgi:GTP-binding protein HflX
MIEDSQKAKILIVGLLTPLNKTIAPESYFKEFQQLVKTNIVAPTFEYFTKLREIDSSTYLTKGKLQEIKEICLQHEIDEVIFSEKLSPHQEMKLEEALQCQIYDRTHLILEIFEKQAQTEEAKLQVKIAFLEHKKTRVSGRGVGMSQQFGRFGVVSGAGETQKELDLRHIDHLLVRLKKEIKNLQAHKMRQRKERLKNNVFSLGLVGYTNAGKSTLFNTLTKESVFAEDKLFATLTTTTRELFLDEEMKNKVVLSDTVGFIQNLPHELIASFHSTLEDLRYAHVLIHVIDVSHESWQQQKATVEETIKLLGLEDKKIIEVYNKVDLIDSEEQEKYERLYAGEHAFFLQANKKATISELLAYLRNLALSRISL